MTIVGLDHTQITLPPGAEDTARRFYVDVLGLTEVPKPGDLAVRGGAWFDLGDGRALHLGVDPEHQPAPRRHPALVLDDFDASVARLGAAGFELRDDVPVDGRRRTNVTDPFGNRIELIEPAAAGPFTLRAIGFVDGGRTEAIDDDWGDVEATIALDPARFTPDALAGLEDFTHLDVVYLFHRVEAAEITTTARHPRGRTDWPEVGIFAQRGKGRPNRLGVTTCRLLGVDGLSVRVCGLDAIHGTPVLDVKPHMVEFGPRGTVGQPVWSHELMAGYW